MMARGYSGGSSSEEHGIGHISIMKSFVDDDGDTVERAKWRSLKRRRDDRLNIITLTYT